MKCISQHDSASHVNYGMIDVHIVEMCLRLAGHVPTYYSKYFPIIPIILDHTKSNASIFGQWLGEVIRNSTLVT